MRRLLTSLLLLALPACASSEPADAPPPALPPVASPTATSTSNTGGSSGTAGAAADGGTTGGGTSTDGDAGPGVPPAGGPDGGAGSPGLIDFAASSLVPVGLAARALAAGDFDRDGKVDLAVAGGGAEVVVLPGRGDGTFQKPVRTPLPVPLQALVVGDFDGDGRADLAGFDPGSGQVLCLLGRGDGSFDVAAVAVRPGASALAAGDLDRDGHLDLVVGAGPAGASEPVGGVLLGSGDGRSFAQAPHNVGGFGGMDSLVVADFDQNGTLDVLGSVPDWGEAVIQYGAGDGSFMFVAAIAFAQASPMAVAYADLSGDGVPDALVATASGAPDLEVFQLNPTCYDAYRSGEGYSTGRSPSSLAAADFDRDGRPDLAVANQGDGTAAILRNDGGGRLALARSVPLGPAPRSLVAADLDGDGRIDVAAASEAEAGVRVALQR